MNVRRRIRWFTLWAALHFGAGTVLLAQQPPPTVTATLEIEASRLYTGQRTPITLTIRAQGVTLGQQFNLTGLPAGDHLRFGTFRELPMRHETMGQTLVAVHQFRCDAVAGPPGELLIEPTLHFEILSHERSWFGTTTVRSPQQLRLQPLRQRILPLPADNRPEDYSGAVGQYALAMEAAPQELAVGDLVTLRFQVQGAGGLDAIPPPRLGPHPDFRVYDPRKMESTETDTHLFEQVIIPLSTNAQQTPGARFVFFDPRIGNYRTLQAEGLPLRFRERGPVADFAPYRPEPEGPLDDVSDPAIPLTSGQTPRAWLRFLSRDMSPETTSTRGVTLRLAPSVSAQPNGEIPKGSRLTISETWQDWVRVKTDRGEGWIPTDALLK